MKSGLSPANILNSFSIRSVRNSSLESKPRRSLSLLVNVYVAKLNFIVTRC